MAPSRANDDADRHAASVLEDYQKRGLAARLGFGDRPAVLVVDFILGFTDPSSPLGSDLEEPLGRTLELLAAARAAAVPVFFTTTVYEPSLVDAGLFVRKVPSLSTLRRGSEWVRLDPRLCAGPTEPVIEKRYASAFFGTHLASTLVAAGIDTVVVTGCTTSGCVRASVVDAMQHGFRAIVPRQCVGDRAPTQHAASLVDIDGKYGDVMDAEEVVARIAGARGGSA